MAGLNCPVSSSSLTGHIILLLNRSSLLPDVVLLEEFVSFIPSFSHTDGLLLHGFMDADAIVFLDAVELIDAAQTAIRQNQGSGLQVPVASILHCSHRQTFGTSIVALKQKKQQQLGLQLSLMNVVGGDSNILQITTAV